MRFERECPPWGSLGLPAPGEFAISGGLVAAGAPGLAAPWEQWGKL